MDVFKDAEQLQQVPMFARLEPSKLKLLAFTSEQVEFDDGETIFHVNEPSNCAYVIMDGEVDVFAEGENGALVPIITLGKNELVGEMAVLSNAPRSATLKARGNVRTLRIANETFLKLVTENAHVALHVMKQLSDKIANTTRLVEKLQRELKQHEAGTG
jgi:CRP-like cAMP-binding protein